MIEPIIPVILCGGAGTRLWPASREGLPKQFLPLMDRLSTFQQTARRVSNPDLFGRLVIVTNQRYRFLVEEQLEAIGATADLLLEPARRDSGPAFAAAAEYVRARCGDATILVLAADHVVSDDHGFWEACWLARDFAGQGRIMTFGVRPKRPATEYGYIKPGRPLGKGAFEVAAFVEKPDEATARTYLAGGYLWNSGNFMFRASVFLDEFRAFEPASAHAVAAAVKHAGTDLGAATLKASEFEKTLQKSVDYAVMERTDKAAVIPVTYDWSDVGSWNTVWELSAQDQAGNAMRGNVTLLDVKGSYVAADKTTVALLGVEDVVVIASEDAILVADRNRVGEMKGLIEQLKTMAPAVIADHLRVHRPWGTYHALGQGDRYQVKRIIVKPGKRLSLQRHNHRAEHWVVVRGTARVTVGDDVKVLYENQSTYIPIGATHRLENTGKIDLELIEVQTGSYLGEDDIERFDDDYRRS